MAYKLQVTDIKYALRLAEQIHRRYTKGSSGTIELEDLRCVALVGLCEAAFRFDDNRDTPFLSYCVVRIKGACLDYIRKELGRGPVRTIGYDKKFQLQTAAQHGISETLRLRYYENNGGLEVTYLDDELPDHRCERQELLSLVRRLLGTLHDEKQSFLRAYYFEEKTLYEIGSTFGGHNASWAYKKHKRLLAELQGLVTDPQPCDNAAVIRLGNTHTCHRARSQCAKPSLPECRRTA